MDKLRKIFRQLKGAVETPAGLTRPDRALFDPFHIDGLIVRCHVSWPEAALLARWRALANQAASATVFHTPCWQEAAWKAGGTPGRLRIITVHRGEDLLGVWPLFLNPAGGLHSIGAAVSDYLDPLVAEGQEASCSRAVLSFALSEWDQGVAELTLHNLRSTDTRRLIEGYAESLGFSFQEKVIEHAPLVALPKSWENYLDSLEAHERKELRRKISKAETKGEAELVRGGDDALMHALHLMEQREGDKRAAIKQYVRPLLEMAGPTLMREGRMEVLELRILGRVACSLVQFPHPQGPMLYNMGWDSSMKQWSPGVVAVGMAIREAIAQGFATYDLMRGREPYKYKLGAVDRPLYKITLKKK